MKALSLLPLLMLAVPVDAGQRAHITSVYSKIDWHRCKTLREGEGAFLLQRCPGYAGIPLFVEYMDDRAYISAGTSEGEMCLSDCVFSDVDGTIEWRLSNGKPFSIIYRLHLQWPGESGRNEASSSLVVVTIGREGHPGCAISEIKGREQNANALARAAADQILTGKVKCLEQ